MENNQPYKKLADLVITFEGSQIFIRSNAGGVGIVTDPVIVEVLAYFDAPRTSRDFEGEFGKETLHLMESLVEANLLVAANKERDSPVFFGFFSGFDVHRKMLADQERLSKYREAIFATVSEGDVVIDAGAGTGILSVYAAQAGAAKVYAIDNSEMALMIPKLAKENGFDQIIEVVQADFAEVQLPEKADVMVSETFGFWALDEGAIPDLQQCAKRHLKIGGRMIPEAFSLYLAPIKTAPDNLYSVFDDRFDEVRMECLANESSLQSSVSKLDPEAVGNSIFVGRYLTLEVTEIIEEATQIPGPCEALCAYFTLHLSPEIDLTNAPHGATTSWIQATLPILLPHSENQLNLRIEPAPENRRAISLTLTGDVEKTIRIS
ncbi:MAG: 50S ribosomal protein L11 methyltransferase [Cytophagales bacterium]|nr:50S ribosomal protein L11 methyltransferase [Cytophagales bacterium]